VNVNRLTFLISPRCHTGGKYLLIVAAGLLCSLKAKIATLWFLGAGRLLLIRSTTAKHYTACHHHQQCPHDSRPSQFLYAYRSGSNFVFDCTNDRREYDAAAETLFGWNR
jgi:hypothetical protein